MDSIEKIIADQKKTEENNRHQGHGNPGQKLPNKQHSTNNNR